MHVKFYSIDDVGALERCFGEGEEPLPLANLGPNVGELLFDGELSCLPQSGDTVIFDDEEYNVICLLLTPKENSATFLVQPKFFVEIELQ